MSSSINTISQEQALNVILQGVIRGQKSGIYTLPEAEIISKAIRLFTVQKTEEIKRTTTVEEKKSSVESNIQI